MAIDRGAFTPPPSFNSRPSYPPKSCKSENTKSYSYSSPSPFSDRFHIVHKVPAGDSPYVRAKRVQLIDKDPIKSIPLFWKAINTGDRVDSAVKDMAVVMKQLDRSDEAIEAIRSFRHLCSPEAQDSLDNILIELYKCSGRMEEQVHVLEEKLKRVEEEASFGGKKTKMARSQGKKIHITAEQEYSRLLGNLAWAHLQQNNFKVAEEYYRKGLSIELDRNKQCNLAICLMHMDRIKEARLLLQSIKVSAGTQQMDESYAKSYERAHELLDHIESNGGSITFMKGKENHSEQEEDFDCRSQLDYLDNMCKIGDGQKSGSTQNTPVVSKWKTGNPEEASAQRLWTQPIIRKHRRATQTAAPLSTRGFSRSLAILRRGVKESELNLEKPYTYSEKSSAGSPRESITDQNSCNGDSAVEQAKDLFWPSLNSGKSWADMAEEEAQEGSLNYMFPCNGQQPCSDELGPPMDSSSAEPSSKSYSARRSLTFDHEEKQDMGNFDSFPPKPEALLNLKVSNASSFNNWKSKGTPRSRRLPVFRDITPAAASPRA